MSALIDVLHFSDAGCPWAYSASPALAVLRWRYGEQLRWRHVMIGLTEHGQQYTDRGYTPLRGALGYQRFRRYGMPFAPQVRARVPGTSPACRAVVAVRLRHPERELAAFRALQFAWFTTPRLHDDPADLLETLRAVPGIDAAEVVGAIDDADVREAYEADRALARSAAGSATEFQGKSASTDGPVRYTAPSLIFSCGEHSLEAGGFQPVEAYDALIANLPCRPRREPPPDDPVEALARFPDGLTTQEVAAIMTWGNEPVDRGAAEAALLEAQAGGRATRRSLGDDALWTPR